MRLWASLYCCIAILLSWALGVTVDKKASTIKCGCTTATLPHPRIVLVGKTGVGKSTFGNRLFGITKTNKKEALCSQFNGLKFNNETGKKERVGHKFGIGHGTESYTQTTDWMVGHYLGDPSNPCITIIDTPGIGDTENKDCEHGIALAKGIKEIGSIDAFMLLFKGTDARFDEEIQEQINLYLNIFGIEMWKNTITEFTYWKHDKYSIEDRKEDNGGLNMTVKHANWTREYEKRFSPPTKIPSVFIDPVYKERRAGENEKKINKNQTDLLWNLLTDPSRKVFNCDKRCKAPSGFFSGQPWLLEDGAQKKRLEDRASITWQIWFADCDGTGTKSYTIKHESEGGQTTLLYQLKDEDNTTTIEEYLFPNMTVENETGTGAKLKTIRLTFNILSEKYFGTYFIENEKGVSNKSQIIKIVDGEWEDFGPFGDCSKTCINDINEPLGSRRRERKCKPPQNGGRPCLGKTFEEHECAHPPGDKGYFNRFCPVDATWSDWFEWSSCSANCKTEGKSVPSKSRSRICQQEKYGGKGCDILKNLTKADNQPIMTESQNCTELPKCPMDATLNDWTEWSACTKTCYEEGTAPPQRNRKRTCNKEVITDPTLEITVDTCESLGEVNEKEACEIGFCPVDPVWNSWSAWGSCSATCGDSGTRRRNRGFSPGRNGADPEPTSGSPEQTESCNRKKCPVPATWTWGEWTDCDIDCYEPDTQYRGSRNRTNNCKEGDPKHEYYNCEQPVVKNQVSLGCPELKACASLDHIVAKVADEANAGTNCDVQLRLRNIGTNWGCQTEVLDSPGDSFERGVLEDFREGSENNWRLFLPCKNFFPKADEQLEFQFSCSDAMKLSYVSVSFGQKDYVWDGSNLDWKQWHDSDRADPWDKWHRLTHHPCPAGHAQCNSLTRVRAKVADEPWAGTDCNVKLTLRNSDESFTCQTMTLDGHGSNWERDQAEDYKEEDFRQQFLPCKHFYPKPGKLQFQFTCSDSMKLSSVELEFGSTLYSSQGLNDLDWTGWTNTWHNLY